MEHTKYRSERFVVPESRNVTFRITKHAADQVSVRINEARQQSCVTKINYFRSLWNLHGADVADGCDLFICDDYDPVANRSRASTVDQARRTQDDYAASHWRYWSHPQRTARLPDSNTDGHRDEENGYKTQFCSAHWSSFRFDLFS
jgi:hypothetical protein